MNFVRRPQSFVVSQFSARVASGTRFGTLPGSVLGAFWLPRWLKPLLELLLDRPRAVQDYFFPVLMPSKSAPRGLQDRSKRSPGRQDAPRYVHGAILHPFRLHFGPHLDAKTIPQRYSNNCLRLSGESIQQHCKAAVMHSSAGPVTGAHAPIR